MSQLRKLKCEPALSTELPSHKGVEKHLFPSIHKLCMKREFLSNHSIRVKIVRYINRIVRLQKYTDIVGNGTSCPAVNGNTGAHRAETGPSSLILFRVRRCWAQWPRGLRRRSVATRLLRWWVRIPPEACKSVRCECSVLSDRGLCDELITRPEDSYRLWCVVVCDLETSWMRKTWPIGGCCAN